MAENARDIIEKGRRNVARIEAADAIAQARRHVAMWDVRPTPEKKESRMTEPNWDSWDEWAARHVQNGLEQAAAIFGEEVGLIERYLVKRIEKLEGELGELRAERTVERAAGGDNVVDIPNWRKTRGAG